MCYEAREYEGRTSLSITRSLRWHSHNIKIFLELQSLRWQGHNPGFLILCFKSLSCLSRAQSREAASGERSRTKSKDWGGISQIPYTKFIRPRRILTIFAFAIVVILSVSASLAFAVDNTCRLAAALPNITKYLSFNQYCSYIKDLPFVAFLFLLLFCRVFFLRKLQN